MEWQLRVAAGEPLPCAQEQLQINGHAFEARIYAEDPDNDFLPASGQVTGLRTPQQSRHVRIDSGVVEGDEVSIYYDPMIAKLIVWDSDRDRALARLREALSDYQIEGLTSNVRFLYNLASSDAFCQGNIDTGFIEQHEAEIFRQRADDISYAAPLAGQAISAALQQRAAAKAQRSNDPNSPWHLANNWRLNQLATPPVTITIGQQQVEVEVTSAVLDSWVKVVTQAQGFTLFTPRGAFQCSEVAPDLGLDQDNHHSGSLSAPMNGTVVALLTETGKTVSKGQTLMVIEAMKMEHAIVAPSAGTVSEFFYQPGDLVDGGTELLAFAASEEILQ